MRFEDLKKMLRCMSAFYQNPEVSEEQRYAKALEQMLFVMQNVQDAAFRGGNGIDLERFDYVDVKDWLLCDWMEQFPNTSESLWKEINTCDYAIWGFDSADSYWNCIEGGVGDDSCV